jgi:hypothetical protein
VSVLIATFNHARYQAPGVLASLLSVPWQRQAPKLLGLSLLRHGQPGRSP